MVAIHLTSSFLLIRHFIPFMKKKGWGRIVNISSINGLIAMPGKAPYCFMKHALIGLTKAVALETAENGITCNAVCPAYVETELVMKQIRDRANQNNISYEEMRVAALVGFLCSDEAGSVTGCAIPVDAGYTAR
ncbi:D-beta-hydroxybutyrate dehydrogenase-like [Dreissena polymorpha]|uniref:D-beta-hydroxybutyrate dehydrogenase-like n=1 Tax=Dreissena polymorpha TaxID=45954 RepID=UPI0022655287|nr:D-beta-hydroxybutyrate dehydrogenase-like [Dreissena polymorpha]